MLLPLAIKQTRSMAAMQQLQPEMKRLQEKYANDKQTLNQEMMKLYQTHQVNPIAGCLPMLVQFPIFIALFYTVGGSVEMYGESWYFIPDLAYPDPYAILPILFVISFLDIPKENGNFNGSNTKDDDVCFSSCFLFHDAHSFVGSNALHCGAEYCYKFRTSLCYKTSSCLK